MWIRQDIGAAFHANKISTYVKEKYLIYHNLQSYKNSKNISLIAQSNVHQLLEKKMCI